jgi:hypothetical protein
VAPPGKWQERPMMASGSKASMVRLDDGTLGSITFVPVYLVYKF